MPKSLRALPLRTSEVELRAVRKRHPATTEVFHPDFLAAIQNPLLRERVRDVGQELAVLVSEKGLCRSVRPYSLQSLHLDRLSFAVQLHLYCITLLCHRAERAASPARSAP